MNHATEAQETRENLTSQRSDAYQGEWVLNHPSHGAITLRRELLPAIESGDPESQGFVDTIKSSLRQNRKVYSVEINGQRRKHITYSDVGKNIYGLDYIVGKEKRNDHHSRPALELRNTRFGVVPVFRGYMSRAFLKPRQDRELERQLQQINPRDAVRPALVVLILGVVALALMPFFKKGLDVVFGGLGKLIPHINVDIERPSGKWDMIRQGMYDYVPWLDPVNNHIYQFILNYKTIAFPILAALVVFGVQILTPLLSRFWHWAWNRIFVARYV